MTGSARVVLYRIFQQTPSQASAQYTRTLPLYSGRLLNENHGERSTKLGRAPTAAGAIRSVPAAAAVRKGRRDLCSKVSRLAAAVVAAVDINNNWGPCAIPERTNSQAEPTSRTRKQNEV